MAAAHLGRLPRPPNCQWAFARESRRPMIRGSCIATSSQPMSCSMAEDPPITDFGLAGVAHEIEDVRSGTAA